MFPETTYYYRIAAQNSAGTAYGSENNFITIALPTPIPTPKPTVPSVPTPISSPTPTPMPTTIAVDGNMCGQVTDAVTGKGINGATVTINTGETTTTSTAGR